jgi:hypothetical protein
VSSRAPRRPVTYAEAMDALQFVYRSLGAVLRRRLGQQTREHIELLHNELGRLLSRNDGRRR